MANQFVSWTKEEDKMLEEFYNKITMEEMLSKLPSRSKKSITTRAYRLNLTKKEGWTDEQIEFLKKNYMKKSYYKIGKILDKGTSSVQAKAKELKLKKAKSTPWSDEEIKILKDNFDELTYDEIQELMPHRTIPAIYNKAYALNLTSEDERYQKLKFNQRQFIIHNCDKMSDSELAEKFGVSISAVEDVRKKAGIRKTAAGGSRTMTKPERIISNLLEGMNVDNEFNLLTEGYYPDFTVGTKKVIEVQGDYFHCNPKLYPNGPNASQIDYIVQDYYKKCFYYGNGYKVLYLWEDDILNNLEQVKNDLKDFILKDKSNISH